MGSGPSHIRLDLQILPRVRLAALDALLRTQLVFLQRLQHGRWHTRRDAALEAAAVKKGSAGSNDQVGRVDVQPNQPLGGPAERHPQLVNGQALAQIFQIGASPQGRLANDLLDVATRIDHADRVKIEPLRF
ncbi:MAG: hypothetical protein DMG24_03435 [Acidobacteria bacterium]|nr:MAG: hypothetical protein DMG24_03435 [Acidobacteriota bacterium]